MKFPQMGDTYYYICSVGKIRTMQYTLSYVDEIRKSLGNVFLTEEAAEFALEKRKVMVELEKIDIKPRFDIYDWDNAIEQVGLARFDKYILEVEKCDN